MASGKLVSETVSARSGGDFITATPDKIEYMDVSPKQVVSVATALVPFLEHDDANRALMGSNMQRQAVPLAESGVAVGRNWDGSCGGARFRVCRAGKARRSGGECRCHQDRRSCRFERKGRKRNDSGLDVYEMIKFQRSNQNTCITQTPVVRVGEPVKKGQVLGGWTRH